jgi:ABC-type Zn uptake system ZnuABC Zn-binding protein ZnuA
MKAQHVKVLVKEPYYPDNLTRIVAEKTGATVLTLPESPGGAPGTDDYFSFIDYTVKQIAGALRKATHE